MRRAIFGGTFDPIHRAHLVVAREAADAFSLDQVLFIPAANPPHKEAGTPYEHRYKMVELACRGDSRFSPSRLEEDSRKSYSIYTIERVKAMGGDVFFVIGADAFAEIQTWFRWQDVVREVEFIVVTRPGHTVLEPSRGARSPPGHGRAAGVVVRDPGGAGARRDAGGIAPGGAGIYSR